MTKEPKNKWETISDETAPNEKGDDNDSTIADLIGDNVLTDEQIDDPKFQEYEGKIKDLERKVADNWNKAVGAMAELDNVRKRAERDVAKAHKFGVESLLKELLPILDSLEQALQSTTDDGGDQGSVDAMCEGIELTVKMFSDVLAKFGVTAVNPVGEVFDPNIHEAMSMQDAPDAKPGSVITVFQKGYLLNDRVIRPARVIVAKGKTTNVDERA